MAMTLVVMAAGRGSRFGGMKQVAGLGPSGESLFDYAVYDAVRNGFEDVVFVVSEESAGAVEDHVDRGCGRHVEVRYALQKVDGNRSKPWGTGHAVLTACGALEGRPFGVVNADDFYGQRSYEILGRELSGDHDDHVLVAFRLRESLSPNGGVSRGVCGVEDGYLTSVTELHEIEARDGNVHCREDVALTGDELISANLWGFQASFCGTLDQQFDDFRAEHEDDSDAEFLIGDAVMAAAEGGESKVRVVPTPERFLGVTYKEDVASVQAELAELVAAGRYPSPLWPLTEPQ